jgi:hypothetical protein
MQLRRLRPIRERESMTESKRINRTTATRRVRSGRGPLTSKPTPEGVEEGTRCAAGRSSVAQATSRPTRSVDDLYPSVSERSHRRDEALRHHECKSTTRSTPLARAPREPRLAAAATAAISAGHADGVEGTTAFESGSVRDRWAASWCQ